jgi:hypothetical protein
MTAAALPPSGNTGATLTSGNLAAGVHWLSGTTKIDADTVLDVVAEVTGDSVEVMPRGARGYAARYRIGVVTVLAEGQGPEAEAMGCHLEVTGEGCEVLGLAKLAELYQRLELRATRIDPVVDGAKFKPATMWRAWRLGNLSSAVKIPARAREDRQWRSGDWQSNAEGDTVYLGSTQAHRRLRCYDRRGFTRVELQARHEAAAAIAADLLGADLEVGWAARVLGHIRAFVEFRKGEDTNVSRRPLASWWARFVRDAERSEVRLTGVVVDTFERAAAWVESQVAPILAVYRRVLGREALEELLRQGHRRWTPRHFRLAAFGGSV